MITLQITIYFISYLFNLDIITPQFGRRDLTTIKMAFFLSEIEDGEFYMGYDSGTFEFIVVPSLLSIDFGVLSYVERTTLSVHRKAENVPVILETYYHRLVKGPKNRHMPVTIDARTFEYHCYDLCRVIRFVGKFTFNRLLLFGYETFHDYNKGCSLNESISGPIIRQVTSLKQCMQNCKDAGYDTVYFNQHVREEGHCQCGNATDGNGTDPRNCNYPCPDAEYHMCGGGNFLSIYTLIKRKSDHMHRGIRHCLSNPLFCDDCPGKSSFVCDLEDRNECTIYDSCGPYARCRNMYSTYDCYCPQGFNTDVDHYNCTDIDECAVNLYECRVGYCTNIPGSYECRCEIGFTIDRDRCADVNECAEISWLCQEGICTNTEGSFKCTCHIGYELSNFTCIDIDECSNTTSCPEENPRCINIPGSFICTCSEDNQTTQTTEYITTEIPYDGDVLYLLMLVLLSTLILVLICVSTGVILLKPSG